MEERTYEQDTMEIEITDMDNDYAIESVNSEAGIGTIGKVVVGVGLATIGAAIGWGIANKDKIKAKKIEKAIAKAEKAGCIVIRPEVTEEKVEEVCNENEDENEVEVVEEN